MSTSTRQRPTPPGPRHRASTRRRGDTRPRSHQPRHSAGRLKPPPHQPAFSSLQGLSAAGRLKPPPPGTGITHEPRRQPHRGKHRHRPVRLRRRRTQGAARQPPKARRRPGPRACVPRTQQEASTWTPVAPPAMEGRQAVAGRDGAGPRRSHPGTRPRSPQSATLGRATEAAPTSASFQLAARPQRRRATEVAPTSLTLQLPARPQRSRAAEAAPTWNRHHARTAAANAPR